VKGVGTESQDIVSMSDAMVRDLLSVPELMNRPTPPRIIVDPKYFRNESSEIIDKALITDRIRVNLIRSAQGRMRFVGREYAGAVEEERELKDAGKVDVGTTGRTRAQAGADYRRVCRVGTRDAIDRLSGTKSRFSQYTFELLDMEKGEIIYRDYVNVGLAVDTPRGLVVPVLRDCDQLSIPQVAQAVAETAEKAKNAQYGIEDLRGGTFTNSHLGAVGGAYSTPIINWPEVAILLLGRSRKMPIVHDDKIESRLMMPLSLSYDHRIIDGAMAARFLNEVIGYLESPGRLLNELLAQ
jgi:hypothetical protein